MNLSINKYGYIVIIDIINNHLITRKYQGYTKSQAKKLFKQEFKNKQHDYIYNYIMVYNDEQVFVYTRK